MLVFNANKEFEVADSAITSIYYDNAELDLYKGRLEKSEGAEAVRLRWYGGMDNQTIFVERKTHREDWTGEKSVKARFAIKEKNVNAFMRGDFTVEQVFEKMRKEKKKSAKGIDENMRLAEEVQYAVLSQRLRPVMRSFYNRTAFQLPGDARVRISLDTELTLVREDNFDGHGRARNNWRRMDIGIDWPFKQLPADDICRFPYAVLEVKLQTQLGQEPPMWIRELIASHLVEAVPKFSKFIHGCATLLTDRVDLVPYWYPQMDVDIRKPATHAFGITRSQQNSSSVSESVSSEPPHAFDLEEVMGGGAFGDDTAELDYFAGDDENAPLIHRQRESERPALSKVLNIVSEQLAQVAMHLHVMPSQSAAGDVFDRPPTIGTVFETKFSAPPGKRIAVPVRIEPKVYFANERTFLAWLEFSILLGAIAAGLLNFGDGLAVVASITFTAVALAAMIYSLGLYIWRAQKIRKRRASRFDDRIGPSVLCSLLLIAWGINFYVRL